MSAAASARRLAACVGCALWLAGLAACPEAGPRRRHAPDGCSLTTGHALARGETSHYDDQAIAPWRGGALAAWSEPRGTFSRRVNGEGAPLAAAERVGERCAGGLSLLAAGGRGYLACLRPTQGAYVIELDAAGRHARHEYLGKAGRDSLGVALVAWRAGWVAAWHDGTPGAYGIWLVESGAHGPSEARLLSDPTFAASAPTLAVEGERWIAAWAETRFDAEGKSSTRIAIKRGSEPATSLGAATLDQPAPRLVARGGRRWLGVRSQQPGDRQPQLYVVDLSPRLKPIGDPVRIGRANTRAPAALLDCGARRFASMSRMYGGERFVAVHPLDARLASIGGGYQYYANSRDYDGVASSCSDQGMLVLVAERTGGFGDGARLMAAALRCP